MATAMAAAPSLLTASSRRPSLLPSALRQSAPARRHSCTIVAARNFKTGKVDNDPSNLTVKSNQTSEDLQNKAKEYVQAAQDRWERVEEKPAAVAIIVTALIVVWAASGLIDRIDKLPLVGGVLELVGLIVTGWFVYRYLVFGPDREELKQSLDKFLSKVTGKSSNLNEVVDKITKG